jgi:hypothetical protein
MARPRDTGNGTVMKNGKISHEAPFIFFDSGRRHVMTAGKTLHHRVFGKARSQLQPADFVGCAARTWHHHPENRSGRLD